MQSVRFLPLLLALAACSRAAGSSPATAQFNATWDGGDRGSGRFEASALYCDRDSTLQILAHRGDRGVGVALHLASLAPAPGVFDLVNPEAAEIPRPAATGAYRFLTLQALYPFVSRSGRVEVTDVSGGITGSLEMTLTARDGPDTVVVRATFAGIPIDSLHKPCGLAPPKPVEIF